MATQYLFSDELKIVTIAINRIKLRHDQYRTYSRCCLRAFNLQFIIVCSKDYICLTCNLYYIRDATSASV